MNSRQTDALPYQPEPQQTQPITSEQGGYASVPPVAASPTTTGHNPYEFILSAQPPKPSKFGSGSLAKRILLVCVGLGLLAVIAMVAMNLLGSKGVSREQLVTIAQQQQEIVRIAQTANSQATGQATKDIATTIDLSVNTDQQKLLEYGSKINIKIDKKQLNLKKDTKTDAFLDNAQASSTYDAAWRQTMQTMIASYKSNLTTLFDSTESKSLKDILNKSFNNATLIEEQLKTMP